MDSVIRGRENALEVMANVGDELDANKELEEAIALEEGDIENEEISLQAACDWLEYKTDRRMSAPGLKKHIDKKYGLRSERLGTEPTSLLAR